MSFQPEAICFCQKSISGVMSAAGLPSDPMNFAGGVVEYNFFRALTSPELTAICHCLAGSKVTGPVCATQSMAADKITARRSRLIMGQRSSGELYPSFNLACDGPAGASEWVRGS